MKEMGVVEASVGKPNGKVEVREVKEIDKSQIMSEMVETMNNSRLEMQDYLSNEETRRENIDEQTRRNSESDEEKRLNRVISTKLGPESDLGVLLDEVKQRTNRETVEKLRQVIDDPGLTEAQKIAAFEGMDGWFRISAGSLEMIYSSLPKVKDGVSREMEWILESNPDTKKYGELRSTENATVGYVEVMLEDTKALRDGVNGAEQIWNEKMRLLKA